MRERKEREKEREKERKEIKRDKKREEDKGRDSNIFHRKEYSFTTTPLQSARIRSLQRPRKLISARTRFSPKWCSLVLGFPLWPLKVPIFFPLFSSLLLLLSRFLSSPSSISACISFRSF